MFHHALSSVLGTVFDLAFAILPAAPLLALKRRPPSPAGQPAKSALSKSSAALNPPHRQEEHHDYDDRRENLHEHHHGEGRNHDLLQGLG
jgi:hypothetical protein